MITIYVEMLAGTLITNYYLKHWHSRPQVGNSKVIIINWTRSTVNNVILRLDV